MWFYWYWYQHVIIGLVTLAIMNYIQYKILDGSDILLSIIKYFREKK